MWDIESGEVLHRFTGHKASVKTVSLSPPEGDLGSAHPLKALIEHVILSLFPPTIRNLPFEKSNLSEGMHSNSAKEMQDYKKPKRLGEQSAARLGI